MILSAGGGSPITPVEEMKTSFGLAAEQLRRGRRGGLDDLPAGAAGEDVGIAGIDDDRRAPCRPAGIRGTTSPARPPSASA